MKITARCLNNKRARITLEILLSHNRDMVVVKVLKVTGVKPYDVLRIGTISQTRQSKDPAKGSISFTVLTTRRTSFSNVWEPTHWRFNRLPRLLRYLLVNGKVSTNDPRWNEFTASMVTWIKLST